jgi:glycosyltransferase involved in cell wall biosynthesis
MNIGIDCRMYSTFYGIGRYTHELVTRILKINESLEKPHSFTLFFNPTEFKTFEEKAFKHIKKIQVNANHYSLSEQTTFLKALYKEKLDTIHFPHFNIPYFYNRPFTVTIHDLTLSLFPGQKMNKFHHRLAYDLTIKHAVNKAKRILTVSRYTKNDVIRFLKAPPEKINVTHLGVSDDFNFITDTKVFIPTLKKFKLEHKQFFLYAGVWRTHKNIPRLIEAFHLIKQKTEKPFKLVLTGKPDPLYKEVPDTIKKFKLENDVILTGSVTNEELSHLYNAAFIFTFPSLYEGFGLPPLESMKCGTPVVASFSSSLPEVLKENAIYFDPYDVNDMAEKILSLAKDADKQADLVAKGFAHANTFSWQKMAEKSLKVITGE